MNSRNLEYSNRANQLIPGGAHTYSKGEDQFPSNAPKIIERGLGSTLWDVDGNQYTDLAMSLGAVILGHAYEPVLEAVRSELVKGVNFCRPSIIEGQLAELLVDTIPSAEMVKFGKNGSDAVTAATKLARAFTGRKYIVRCQDDAFNAIHDWFIGSTIMNGGIPAETKALTLKFKYNDLNSCEKLFAEYPGEIACVLLEPISMEPPEKDFLSSLKLLCEKNGALLIFDEVVSGFRFALGGVQEMTGITPHLSAFGKAMANGFSVSALVGQREFMSLGGLDHKKERLFLLSTTHGGETHSLAAAIATVQEIKKCNAIEHFWKIGALLCRGIEKVSKEIGADKYIETAGYSVKPSLIIKDEAGLPSLIARTLFMQEMIKKSVLMPYIVPSLAHDEKLIDSVVQKIGDVLVTVKHAAENGGMLKAIDGGVMKPVFRRYN